LEVETNEEKVIEIEMEKEQANKSPVNRSSSSKHDSVILDRQFEMDVS
jgi:hypothetical protein